MPFATEVPVSIQMPSAVQSENTDDIITDSSDQLTDEGLVGAEDGTDTVTARASELVKPAFVALTEKLPRITPVVTLFFLNETQ